MPSLGALVFSEMDESWETIGQSESVSTTHQYQFQVDSRCAEIKRWVMEARPRTLPSNQRNSSDRTWKKAISSSVGQFVEEISCWGILEAPVS